MTWLAIKLFFGGVLKRLLGAATALFDFARRNPWQAAVIALLLALAWTWHGKSKAIEQRDAWIVAFDKQKAAYIAAQKAAEAKAIAAKLAQEAKDEQRRKDADNALKQDMLDDRRRTDAYASRMRYKAPRSAPSGTDLPSTPEATSISDGPGDFAELVGITRTDLDLCTVNSRRLQNAHDWATINPEF